MMNRDWFCLALRLLGIWMLVQTVEYVVALVPMLFLGGFESIGLKGFSQYLYPFIWLVGRTTLGFGVLLFAPVIATRFYPSKASAEPEHPELDESRLLRVGIQLLAVYALLLAVQSGAGLILGLLATDGSVAMLGATSSGTEASYLQHLLSCGLNLGFAAILIMWNTRVITLIEKIRYIPERDAYEPPPIEE